MGSQAGGAATEASPLGEQAAARTPVVACIDWLLNRLRIFTGHKEWFERIRGLLVTAGLYTVLAVAALGLLAAAPLLFGVGTAVAAVWVLVAMVSAWAGHGGLDVLVAFGRAVVFALPPLCAYLHYLPYMMAVDFYLAVLRTARNRERR